MKKLLEILSFYTTVPKIMIICYNVPEIWSMTDVIFSPFTSPNSLKNEDFKTMKISKKWKKTTWRYRHFMQVYQKSWSHATLFLRYGVWRMWLLFFFLGYFSPFYPPDSPNNQNFKKRKKKPGDIIINLDMCTKYYD